MQPRFHWRLPQGDDRPGDMRDCSAPHLEEQIPFCRDAERLGFDSLLVDFGIDKADSIVLSTALGMATSKIRFLIAYRSGLLAPTSFVQQLNTLSSLIDGRISLNIVAGSTPDEQRAYGDYLEHDDRWARTDEFLTIARGIWRDGVVDFDGAYYRVEQARVRTAYVASDGSRAPQIYVGGASEGARMVAGKHANCLLLPADVPSKIAPRIAPIVARGVEAGLRVMVIARRTHHEAVEAAHAFRDFGPARVHGSFGSFASRSDSQMVQSAMENSAREWLTPWLWTGAVATQGMMATAIVGSYDEVATAILEYQAAGITQFILSGWPKREEMHIFGSEVMGRVLQREAVA
ncbi:MAG TPA: LLM class flavin-dependent oxidoreductase [Thermoanaerobaculia bacterium]|nr:LLM class flavin-dependent oxidoreductase [Thermoanaerobaculia bacterium]